MKKKSNASDPGENVENDASCGETGALSKAKANRYRLVFLTSIRQRFFSPHRWSLKGRFVYLSALLLLLGNFSMVVFFYISLESNIRESATTLLKHHQMVLLERLETGKQALLEKANDLAAFPQIQQGLISGERTKALAFLLKYSEKSLGTAGGERWQVAVYRPSARVLLRNYDTDTLDSTAAADGFLDRIATSHSSRVDIDWSTADGPVVRALVPVYTDYRYRGFVTVSLSLDTVLSSGYLPENLTVQLVLPGSGRKGDDTFRNNQIDAGGAIPAGGPAKSSIQLGTDTRPRYDEGRYSCRLSLAGENREGQGGHLLIIYDVADLWRDKYQDLTLLVCLFFAGSLVLILLLHYNVGRVEQFLRQLKGIILAFHSNDFSQRFDSNHVHCRDVLGCPNVECSLYEKSDRVCYLVTGSEAMSPRLRGSCIHLDRFLSCKQCPVYRLHNENELTDMRNVVNTLMRDWRSFLMQIGHLLAYVLRRQEQTGRLPFPGRGHPAGGSDGQTGLLQP